MGKPNEIVEIAYNKLNGAYVWNDVSSFFREASVSRGTSRELDVYAAGSCSVKLSNTFREFDPTYTTLASTRTNLFTNPSLEVDTTSWSANLASIARVTSDFYKGTASLEATWTGSAGDAWVNPYSPQVTVVAGQSYAASVYVKEVTTARPHTLTIDWYAFGGYISSSTAPSVSVLTTGWSRLSVVAIAPNNAIKADFRIRSTTAPAASSKTRYDAAMFEQSSTLNDYFDGSTYNYLRTNLITNPSFETNTTGWTTLGTMSIARTTSTACVGSASAQLTNGSGASFLSAYPSSRIPVVNGETYTFSYYIKNSTSTAQWQATISGFDVSSGGTRVAFQDGGFNTINTSAWIRLFVTWTIPAGVTYIEPKIQNGSGETAGGVAFVDAVLLEKSATLTNYFDGYSALEPNVSYSWSGSANASTSLRQVYGGLFSDEVKPAGAVKITSDNQVIFYGFIDSWSFEFMNSNHDSVATLVAYDGLSNLSKTALLEYLNVQEYIGPRISGVLNKIEVNWDDATDIDFGYNQVTTDEIADNTNTLQYIQQVAKAESGDFFVSRDGTATFRDRTWLSRTWSVSTTRTNYCKNPNFETDTSYWQQVSSSGPHYSRVSSPRQAGGYALSVGYDYIGQSCNINYTDGGGWSSAGRFSAYVYTTVAQNITLSVLFTPSGVNPTTTVLVSANTWTRLSVTGTPTGGVNGWTVYLSTATGNSAGFYVDSVLAETGATLNSYFDGTFVPIAPSNHRYTTAWTGLPNASTSVLTDYVGTINPTVSYLSLSDASGSDIPIMDMQVSYSSERLFNRISLIRNDGSTMQPTLVAEDTALQAAYGVRTFADGDYLNIDDASVLAIAKTYLTSYSRPELRVESITIATDAISNAAKEQILGIDIRSMIRLTYQPLRMATQEVAFYNVIGVNHEIVDNRHMTTLSLGSLANQPFRLDSNVVGVLDSNVLSY